MAVLVTLLAVVVALLALLVVGLLRSHAEILRSLHGLGVDLDPDADPGSVAPRSPGISVPRPGSRDPEREAVDIVGVTPTGDGASIAVAGARHPTLLAFLTSGCSTCAGFWTAFADNRRLHVPGEARLVVVTKGEEAESPARLRKFAPPGIPVVMSSAAWDAYDVPVAPYFAFVDGPSSRVVGEGAAGSWEHLAQMMEQAIADAGIAAPRRGRRARRADGAAREARVDAQLLASGIEPGDPSLYPSTTHDLHHHDDIG
jgi:hypothetical protein